MLKQRSTSLLFILLIAAVAPRTTASPTVSVTRDGDRWTIQNPRLLRVISLDRGQLVTTSFKDAGGTELIPAGSPAEEFFLSIGDPPQRVSSASGGWELVDARQMTLREQEVQLEITLRCGSLMVVKSYVIYPESSIIREWIAVKNAGDKPVRVTEPSFLNTRLKTGDPAGTDFMWMTGGENQPGSWMLQTEKLDPAKPRCFDSYDPFGGKVIPAPGDGVNACIRLNDRQIWPEKDWQHVPDVATTVPFDVEAEVKVGDRLSFVVNMNGGIGWDTTRFDPMIAYDGGEKHKASAEFSGEQARSGWRYQYIENGKPVDLVWYPQHRQWRKAVDNITGTPFVSATDQHPDAGQDVARVWTAPRAGKVRLTGSVCNTGNVPGSGYGFRMGTSTYAPWAAVFNKQTKQGAFIGWDYFGHWASSYKLESDGGVTAQLRVAGHRQTLAPGESLVTPKAFVGLFRDDLDNAGNEVLDWQYRHMWDYTREGWFPAIRMLGYWMKGTCWTKPECGWLGGHPDFTSTQRKVFRVADLMRYVGADVYHRDWGWWDRAGDWSGPDFRATGDYLRKHGMGQLIYAFLYTVHGESKVGREHPDWLIGNTMDMSQPAVVEFMKSQLDEFVGRWGDFEWRNDSTPTSPRKDDDTPLLGQDQGLREVIRGFLDKYPGCAFQAVNGGGNNAGYDYARYASTVSFSDGAVGIIRNYWASLVLPPDKTSDIPDIWDPAKYDKATWRGLLCINFDMTGDTWDPVKLEGIRELIDIYHYLQKQGVVGRWVHVYRPVVVGDDPTMYFQRLSRNGERGIIIPKRPAPGPVTIKPKGLRPDAAYTVSFQETDRIDTRDGDALMRDGIRIEEMPPGELIYLNLPLHPGSKKGDREPPSVPGTVTLMPATHLGYPGVDLTWTASTDNNWVSYYEIFRNGKLIDKVAKGTYYFDHSAGADVGGKYTVAAVDGAGNRSGPLSAQTTWPPAQIIDDSDSGVRPSGQWRHESNLQPAHAGTISAADQKGAAVEVTLTGKRLLWFSKLGADCGKALVSIDGGPPETIDTYSADDIWGVGVFVKELPTAGPHELRIEVAGEHDPRSIGNLVHVDGFRAQAD